MKITVTDLLPGGQYALQFRSKNKTETSPWSRTFVVQVGHDLMPPAMPENLAVEVKGDAFISTWDKVTTSDDGSVLTDFSHYIVRIRDVSSGFTVDLQSNAPRHELTFNLNLALFFPVAATIGVQVAAVDLNENMSDFTDEIIVQNPPPNPVRNLTVEPGLESLVINFDKPLDLEDDFLEYRIFITNSATTTIDNETDPVWAGQGTSYTYHTMSMVPLYTHVVAVDKFNSISEVVTSDAVTPKNSFEVDVDAPSIPTDLAGTIEDYNLNLTWTKPIESDLLGYQIGFRKVGSSGWSYSTAMYDVESTTITPIEQFVDYDVRIRAHDVSFNYSGWSNTVVVAGETNIPPAVPTGLQVKGAITSAMVFWDKNTESDLQEYEVQFRDVTPTGDTPDAVTPATIVSFSEDVNQNTTYYARVRAVDNQGLKSAWSAVAEGTVGFLNPGDIPLPDLSDGEPPASSPRPTPAAGIKSVFLTWAPAGNADPVTYEIHVGTTTGFTPAAGTKVGETSSTFTTVQKLPNGTDFLYNTNYYFKLIAKDVDGAAAPSTASIAVKVFSIPNEDIDWDGVELDLPAPYRGATRPSSPKKNSFWYPPNGQVEFWDGNNWSVIDLRPTVIAEGFIGSAHIANAAITTAKIGNAQIIAAKIKDAEITTAKISDLAVTEAKINNLAVTDAKIVNLDGNKINANSIYTRSLVVSPNDNVWPDPWFQDTASWESSMTGVINDAAAPGGTALNLKPSTESQYSYYVNSLYRGIKLNPGEYRLRYAAKRGGSAPHPTVMRLYMRYSDAANVEKTFSMVIPYPETFSFQYYEADFFVPADVAGGATVSFWRAGIAGAASTSVQVADVSMVSKVNATTIEDGAITTDKLMVGDGKNLVPNGTGEWGKVGGWLPLGTYQTAGKPNGVSGFFETVAGQGTISTNVTNGWWSAEPGEEFAVEVWLKANKAGSVFFFELRDQDGNHATTNTDLPGASTGSPGGASYPIGNTPVPTTWTKFGSLAKANANVSRMQVGSLYFNHANGTVTDAKISIAVRIRRRSGSVTIANGAITGDHVQTKTLGADVIKTGEIAADDAFLTNLTVTNANITTLDAHKLTAGNGLITNLTVAAGLTIGDATRSGWIRSYNYNANNGYQIGKDGIIVNSGSISAKALKLQVGQNVMPAAYSNFEFPSSFYDLATVGAVTTSIVTSDPKYGDQSLYIKNTGTTATRVRFTNSSELTRNISVQEGETYIMSLWARGHIAPSSFRFLPEFDGATSPSLPYMTIPASNTWTRYSQTVTIPAGVSTMFLSIFINTGTAGRSFWVDGVQVEPKTGSEDSPSVWTPGSAFTAIDGGIIRTGEIRSNQNVTVNGKSQPMWSINMAGNMQIGNALVRGSLVVGSDIGGTDGIHSTIQSHDYAPGSAGWIIRSGGNSEFNDVKIRGSLGIVDIDAGGRIQAGTATHYTRMNATSFAVYSSSRVAFFAGTGSVYMNKPGTTERVFTINSSGGTFNGELEAFSGTNTGVRVTPTGQVGTNGVRGIVEFLDGGTSLGRIGAFSNGTLNMYGKGDARISVTDDTASMTAKNVGLEAPNIRIEGLSAGKVELISNSQPVGTGRGDITLKAGGGFTYSSVPGGDVTIQAGVRAVSNNPLHYFEPTSHIFLDANEVEVRGGTFRVGENAVSSEAAWIMLRTAAYWGTISGTSTVDVASHGSLVLKGGVAGTGNNWTGTSAYIQIHENQRTTIISALADQTTTIAGNVYTSTSGSIYRSTSLSKYKIVIEDASVDLKSVKSLRPVTYYDRGDAERYAGLLSGEDVVETDINPLVPQLGLLAEDVEATGVPGLATYGPDGELSGVAYERVGVALIPWLHELEAANADLRQDNADLRGMIEDLAAKVASLTQP